MKLFRKTISVELSATDNLGTVVTVRTKWLFCKEITNTYICAKYDRGTGASWVHKESMSYLDIDRAAEMNEYVQTYADMLSVDSNTPFKRLFQPLRLL